MTTLRFVGDLPLWLGLLHSLIVCVLSWRYYSRESFDLPRRLKWILPLLRSLAFFLGIVILTGPVLHHRTIIGELGKVKIYIDGSRSMTMHDRHMSPGRKLLIAEQLGWLSSGRVDATLLTLADEFAEIRQAFEEQFAVLKPPGTPADGTSGTTNKNTSIPVVTSPVSQPAAMRSSVEAFQKQLTELLARSPNDISDRIRAELLLPLESALPGIDSNSETTLSSLNALQTGFESIEAAIRNAFDNSIDSLLKSDDESVRSALAMFDETPRWRRTELGLEESSAHVLKKLREQHDVEVLRLAGPEAALQNETGRSIASSVNEPAESENSEPKEADFSSITDLSSGVVSTQKSVASVNEKQHRCRICGDRTRIHSQNRDRDAGLMGSTTLELRRCRRLESSEVRAWHSTTFLLVPVSRRQILR